MRTIITCLSLIITLFLAGCPGADAETADAPEAKPKGPLQTVRGQLDAAGAEAQERLDAAEKAAE